MRIVMLGVSYRFRAISLARAAQLSPRKKQGSVRNCACVENRAEMPHIASISTGGTFPVASLRMKLGLCKSG